MLQNKARFQGLLETPGKSQEEDLRRHRSHQPIIITNIIIVTITRRRGAHVKWQTLRRDAENLEPNARVLLFHLVLVSILTPSAALCSMAVKMGGHAYE
jgi:hypothetical protein